MTAADLPGRDGREALGVKQRKAIAETAYRMSFMARDCGHEKHNDGCPFCADVRAYLRLIKAFPWARPNGPDFSGAKRVSLSDLSARRHV